MMLLLLLLLFLLGGGVDGFRGASIVEENLLPVLEESPLVRVPPVALLLVEQVLTLVEFVLHPAHFVVEPPLGDSAFARVEDGDQLRPVGGSLGLQRDDPPFLPVVQQHLNQIHLLAGGPILPIAARSVVSPARGFRRLVPVVEFALRLDDERRYRGIGRLRSLLLLLLLLLLPSHLRLALLLYSAHAVSRAKSDLGMLLPTRETSKSQFTSLLLARSLALDLNGLALGSSGVLPRRGASPRG
ncbi:hypothetical protein Mapa_016272 [Marchantia paleacea]|nr:hypothetical protein Mapa_016272 [Marchantia paleacea]